MNFNLLLLILMQIVSCIKADSLESAEIGNLHKLEQYNFITCKGDSPIELKAPESNVIYVEKLVFGINRDESCSFYDPSYCNSNAVITCNLKGNNLKK